MDMLAYKSADIYTEVPKLERLLDTSQVSS